AERAIQDESQKALSSLKTQAEQIQDAIRQATAAPAGRGQHGPGGGGGTGSGNGPGQGSGNGPGALNITQKRLLRWILTIDATIDRAEELNILASIGAYVAMPEPGGGYLVFKELRARHPRGVHME